MRVKWHIISYKKQRHSMAHNLTHLIIYAHPNPESFNQAVLQKVVEASEGHKVIIRDLNAEKFPARAEMARVHQHFQQTIRRRCTKQSRHFGKKPI